MGTSCSRGGRGHGALGGGHDLGWGTSSPSWLWWPCHLQTGHVLYPVAMATVPVLARAPPQWACPPLDGRGGHVTSKLAMTCTWWPWTPCDLQTGRVLYLVAMAMVPMVATSPPNWPCPLFDGHSPHVTSKLAVTCPWWPWPWSPWWPCHLQTGHILPLMATVSMLARAPSQWARPPLDGHSPHVTSKLAVSSLRQPWSPLSPCPLQPGHLLPWLTAAMSPMCPLSPVCPLSPPSWPLGGQPRCPQGSPGGRRGPGCGR